MTHFSLEFIALLSRLAFSPSPQAGRLSEHEAVQASCSLLEAFLSGLAERRWVMRVAMCGRPSLEWPGVCSGTNLVVIDVEVNLRVHLGRVDWEALPSPTDSLARFLQELPLEDGSISVIELLAEVVAWRPRTGAFKSTLLGQVSLQIAIAVEEACLARLGEVVQSLSALSVRQKVFDARTDSLADISKELVHYWQVAEEKFRCMPKHLGLASDKSRVLGLTLMSTVFVGADNVGAWAFPTALFGGGPHLNLASQRLPGTTL